MANAGIERRVDITFPFMGETLAGWLYNSSKYNAETPGPALVLAHGLGAVKELKLDVYADEFNQLGYTCVVFDYRFNGESTGLPRGLVDFHEQQKDWHAAIEYTRSLPNVDPERVGLFGSSFAGGHVIQVAAHDARLKAVISQCPFTDGIASAQTTGLSPLPSLVALGLRDTLFGTKKNPVLVDLVGKPGGVALMNAADVEQGYKEVVPPGFEPQKQVPARIVMQMPRLCPGAYAKKVTCPILFGLCALDTVAPAKKSRDHVKKAPRGVIKWYDDMGHFDIYVGEKHDRAMADYTAFLQQNLPV